MDLTGPGVPPRRLVGARGRFLGYLAAVIGAGAAVLVVAAAAAWRDGLAPAHAGLVAALSIPLVLAEARPIRFLHRHEGGEVTASWAFAFALALSAPAATALLAMALGSLVGDLATRKPASRAAFNVAQITLSLAAGLAVLEASGTRLALVGPGGASARFVVAGIAAAAVTFLLNGLLTSVVVALHQEVPVGPVVREGVAVNLSTDGLLMAASPVFVVVGVHAPLLLPFVLLATWTVHANAQHALSAVHESLHDALTDLPNRKLLDQRAVAALEEASRTGELVAVAMLDLDGFKEINDRLGHRVGDLVLGQVGEVLDAQRRPGDVLARIGGDEFAVLLRHLPSAAAAREAAEALVTALTARPLEAGGLPVAVRASVGLALAPQHGEDLTALLERADVAMYQAKAAGVPVVVFELAPERGEPSAVALLGELRTAIDEHQLVLHYQPVIDLRTGTVEAVEALCRWQHPALGLVAPSRFMPVAEHTELMPDLTLEVLRMALRQCCTWRGEGHPARVAVNGSARNLRDLAFPAAVLGALAEAGLPAEALEIEITETTVIADPERTRTVLARLSEAGVRIAIDDFGTGYSSLSALRDLPVSAIKVDRSFVTSMASDGRDRSLVRAVIDLASDLGLTVVAEGVEDATTEGALRAAGCSHAQGFHYSEPVPGPELSAWLEHRRLGAATPAG